MATKKESPLALKRRARRMGRALAKLYPDAHCELDHQGPLQLTVATILSAQCTDKRVNEVTPALFQRYISAEDYASANRADVEALIRPTGFFRNKANNIIKLSRILVDKYGGEVPRTREELIQLPGVGRKTANVIIGTSFGGQGITVDTHVIRLVGRWEWTQEKDPVKIEYAIGTLFDRRDWTILSHRMVFHGRRVCFARKPACGRCALARDCPSYGIGPRGAVEAPETGEPTVL